MRHGSRLAAVAGIAAALALVLAGCSAPTGPTPLPSGSDASAVPSATVPAVARMPRHIVVVVLENHSFSQVVAAPYLASLERRSLVLTNASAVAHPSEPNYLALWSGSTQGLIDDSCPHRYSGDSLGAQLLRARMSVAGYFESMPAAGFAGCSAGAYVRKHNPLADFAATADAAHSLPLTAFPSGDLAALPRVALVVPNLNDDMHDGSVAAGDAWLRSHIDPYAQWARTHDSLLVVTWDENDDSPGNRILTLVSGQHVRPGRSNQPATHLSVLHTVEGLLGLPALGPAAPALTGIWR
ncbi:MAG: acid phosphatase [Acidobacteria bacterium]|nr:acid phosphatase [Acidobacteriota bacterium]